MYVVYDRAPVLHFQLLVNVLHKPQKKMAI